MPQLIDGVIWQPTRDYAFPKGEWDQIGANTLIIQWGEVHYRDAETDQKKTYIPSEQVIQQLLVEPWAKNIILGMSGDFDLAYARQDWQFLALKSQQISIKFSAVPISSWYAPIEISPEWKDIKAIKSYLNQLPRPLSVSIYADGTLTPNAYVRWVQQWLPGDVKVLFQDGVGVRRHSIKDVVSYAQALKNAFGEERVALILEAFEVSNGVFKSASVLRINHQLHAYRRLSLPIYVFSCRYLPTWKVLMLKAINMFENVD